ncbi:ATP-binding protein [Solwaraspora sp. WMMB335]|uniref:ATP-binding protein n=1 Tax=Solwaraspora sp. WMMB335 TaxID=3404118 RepID=UPI003B93C379
MTGGQLFGRAGEQVELDGLLAQAIGDQDSCHGGSLALRGAAGIGKSALVTYAVSRARQLGMRVLATSGVQAEIHVPYGGLHRLLGRLPGTGREGLAVALSGSDEPGHGSFRVSMEVLDLLVDQAVEGPLLLVVEDAQWLDEASWDVLAFLGRRLAHDPVLMLLAIRDGVETERRVATSGWRELSVGPLAEAPAADLLDRHVPGLAPQLRQRVLTEAAGNPLGIVEFGAAAARLGTGAFLPAWLPLSTRVERTFTAIVAELPLATRAVLVVAALDDHDDLAEILAVAGAIGADHGATPDTADTTDIPDTPDMPDTPDTPAGPAPPADERALEPALASDLVSVDAGDRLAFRHPLLRSALLQSTPAAQRRRVHAVLAARLDPTDGRRVWHQAAATLGPDERIAAELTATAERANRQGAPQIAVTALERAAELTAGPAGKAGRLLRAAILVSQIGDRTRLVRTLDAIAEHHLGPAERAHLVWLREVYLDAGWSGATRIPAHLDVVERLAARGEAELALESLAAITVRCWWSGPDPQLRRRIVAVARALPVPSDSPHLLSILAGADPLTEGATVLAGLTRLAGRITGTDPDELRMSGTAADAIGAHPLAKPLLADAVLLIRSQRRLGMLAQTLTGQAWNAALLGDTRLAITAGAEARAMGVETGQLRWALTADLARGIAEALRGNSTAAAGLADQAEAVLLPSGAFPMLAMVHLVRGLDALAGGRYEDAYQQLHRICHPDGAVFHPYLRLTVLGQLAEAAARSGHRDEVAALVAPLAPVARSGVAPVLAVTLRYARAVLAGDGDGAEQAYRDGLAADLTGWTFERARLELAYGAWLRRRRRAAEARAQLRSAAGTFDALGARAWAERARRELRASGESLRRPADGLDRLTPQELQIAQLAAAGLSNREIAEQLFVSPRTVTTHLYRIYPKVGVRSRVELARALPAT